MDEGKLFFKSIIPGGEDVKGVPMITKGVFWDGRESIKYVLSNLPQILTTLTVFTSRLGFLSRARLSVTHIPQHRG